MNKRIQIKLSMAMGKKNFLIIDQFFFSKPFSQWKKILSSSFEHNNIPLVIMEGYFCLFTFCVD
jgi:hypothetical protein